MTKIARKSIRMANFYKIVDRVSNLILFKANEAQMAIRQKKKELRKTKGRVRLIILKGRQLGATTESYLDGLDDSIMKQNQNFVITAQDRETQKKIFERVKLAYRHAPREVKLENDRGTRYKPKTSYDNVNELYFPKINSKISVSLNARAGTTTGMHITEIAFRRDMKQLINGSLPAAPDNCDVVLETTANGTGTAFYTFRNKHYNDPTSEFDTLFLGRWLEPSYRRKLDPGEVINLPKELQHLDNLKDVVLDDEQKKRYMAMYSMLDEDVFQEYPNTPEEAFLATGSSVFNMHQVKALKQLLYDEDDIYPELRIYAKPTKNMFCAVDTSEGSEDGDFTSISFRDIDGRLLACFYGKIPTDEICDVLDRLWDLGYKARLYGIESNNTGLATIKVGRERYNNNTGCERFARMYEEEKFDKATETTTMKLGRHTNTATRPIMVTDYLAHVRKGLFTEFDPRVISEMYSFIRGKTRGGARKAQADQGAHDDGIIADMIVLQMMKSEFIDPEVYGTGQ